MSENLSKRRREQMLHDLDGMRQALADQPQLQRSLSQIAREISKKKYGLLWEEHEEDVYREMETRIPVFLEDESRAIHISDQLPLHFLLEGDNLHSLHLLEKTHRGRVDAIYIDPPYNTGAKDWKYNNDYVAKEDGFRHSKWLSMMAHRLRIAKRLLTTDGVLICAIDENEQAPLMLLLDEIFGEAYQADCITIVHNPRGVQGDNFSYVHEYAIFVHKKGQKAVGSREIQADEITWSSLRNWGTESERLDAANCFYPIFVKDGEIVGFGDDITLTDLHPARNEWDPETGVCAVYPVDEKGIERKWRYARQSVEGIRHLLRVKRTRDNDWDIEIGKDFGAYRTVWTHRKFDANEYGTQLVKSIVPTSDFNFPKSLYNIYECLYAVVRDKPNALVLDFFAGSGTTGHAVLLMNKLVGGCRRFILCTNNAVGEKREREFFRKYGAAQDFPTQWEAYENAFGIARSITHPRLRGVIEGYVREKDTKETLFEKKLTLPALKKAEALLRDAQTVAEQAGSRYDKTSIAVENGVLQVVGVTKKKNRVAGIPGNLKYYKTGFVDKYVQDGAPLDDRLLAYVREMVQLETGVCLPDPAVAVVFSDEELDALEARGLETCRVLYRASQVLMTARQAELFDRFQIEVRDLPDRYFSQEIAEEETYALSE